MKYFQFLFLAFGLALSATSLFGQGANATWRVQKYDLNVTLPQAASDRAAGVRAIVSVKNVSSAPTGTLTLRISPSADVSAVRINDGQVDFTKAEEKIGASTLQRLGTRFPPVAPGGVVTATVDYKLTVKDNSGLAAFSPVGGGLLPLSFWYPTPNSWFFTKGADAAAVRLKVDGQGLQVAGAGRETAGVYDSALNGQPFLVAGSWDVATVSDVSVFLPKGASADAIKRAGELATLYSEARDHIAATLGKAPDAPLRIVASRRGAGFASGGTVIVDEAVFRRQKIDSLTAMNLAEAAAKLWLGGSIMVTGEGGGTITEGLSRYLATQFLESKFGKDVADVERLRQRNAYAAVSKRDAPMATVSPLDDYYYPVVANKGAMVWRILAKRMGADFVPAIKASFAGGNVDLSKLRAEFGSQKPLIDYFFDQVTEMNLLAGVPQTVGGETRVALRNTGAADVIIDVAGTTASGERTTVPVTIRATSYGEAVFRSPRPIVRAEIDADKLYPQIDYSDDVAPRESTESDPVLAVKRAFDKQDFAAAEKIGRAQLAALPRADEIRVLLARAQLAEGKTAEAEREFRAVLDEKLPAARSLAWANVGLAEVAAKAGRAAEARSFAETAISIDGDYGASLAARTLRNTLGAGPIDPIAKAFFADFDKAVAGKRKAEIDALVVPGEISRFAGSVAGSAETWVTQVTHVDKLDSSTTLVETSMNVRLLNKNPESGLAVYRLVKSGTGWKMAAVDIFEVR